MGHYSAGDLFFKRQKYSRVNPLPLVDPVGLQLADRIIKALANCVTVTPVHRHNHG